MNMAVVVIVLHLEFLILVGLFFSVVSQILNNECSTSFCSNYVFPIRFPFRLMNQPQYCGYPIPGFNLSCTNEGHLILNLPYSGDFSVRDIDYLNQEIRLFDPQGWLPSRLLNLNLSLSPFMFPPYDYYDHKNYTFLRCPPQFVSLGLTVIDCLSNSTVSVLVTPNYVLARSMNACTIIGTVPVAFSSYSSSSSDYSDVSADLFLSWNVPNCKYCESRAGTCHMSSNASAASQDILCSDLPAPGGKGTPPGFLRLVGFTVFLPFVILPTLFIGILCCKYVLINREQNNNTTTAARSLIVSQLTNPTRGLDDSIIQSYPMLILNDESRNKIPGENIDLICPICLAEYREGDELRCIPKCDHYFHADCIDEWLRIKITCPVCRTAPSDAASAVQIQNP